MELLEELYLTAIGAMTASDGRSWLEAARRGGASRERLRDAMVQPIVRPTTVPRVRLMLLWALKGRLASLGALKAEAGFF